MTLVQASTVGLILSQAKGIAMLAHDAEVPYTHFLQNQKLN